jgi:Flp pilus assembly protein TadG
MIRLRVLLARLHGDERGQTAIAVVMVFLAVFALFGLALDAGLWYFDHRHAQNQVDAASTAAVQYLPSADVSGSGPAATAAKEWLKHNGVAAAVADAATISTVSGEEAVSVSCAAMSAGTARIVFSSMLNGNYWKVGVCVRRTSPVVFSALGGVGSATVSAAARAVVVEQPSTYALMAMDADDCSSLWATGSGAGVVVTGGGGTYTGSSCSTALRTSGGGVIQTGGNDVVGGYSGSGITPSPVTGIGVLPDPYDHLVQPAATGPCVDAALPNNINGGTYLLLPGRYCKELRVTSDARVTLSPGIYILHRGLQVNVNAGGSFTSDLNGDGTLQDNERVLLFATCPTSPCNGTVAGTFAMAGQGSLRMQGRTEYDNMLIWVDRTSPEASVVSFSGGSVGQLQGRLYALNSDVDFTGSAAGTLTLNMSLVAGTFKFSGQGLVSIPFIPALAPPIRFYELME